VHAGGRNGEVREKELYYRHQCEPASYRCGSQRWVESAATTARTIRSDRNCRKGCEPIVQVTNMSYHQLPSRSPGGGEFLILFLFFFFRVAARARNVRIIHPPQIHPGFATPRAETEAYRRPTILERNFCINLRFPRTFRTAALDRRTRSSARLFRVCRRPHLPFAASGS